MESFLTTWGAEADRDQITSRRLWRTWLILGGRGSGKTRAGAGWLTARARRPLRFALVGATLADVREVMIEGPSGLRAIGPRTERPAYEVSRRRLVWPNGAVALAFSAEEPERLRGPQFHAAWADEFCAWRAPDRTLDQLRLGLRLGAWPQLTVMTTPKPIASLRRLMAEDGLLLTRRRTADNAQHLAPGFLEAMRALYGGTRLEAQELEGMVVDAGAGALWSAQTFAACRGARPPELERTVVAVDPPATATGDACGIVAAGRREGRAYVLADLTVGGLSPLGWGARACEAAARFGAAEIVAEANQGGEMVRAVLAAAGAPCPVRLVHARIGKRARAEPVAALYEQGRVVHCGALVALEEELMALGAAEDGGGRGASPDRADALVWAVTALLVAPETPAAAPRRPRVRVM